MFLRIGFLIIFIIYFGCSEKKMPTANTKKVDQVGPQYVKKKNKDTIILDMNNGNGGEAVVSNISEMVIDGITEVARPIAVLPNDKDRLTHTYKTITEPQNGTLSGTAPDLIYTSKKGFIGQDQFTIENADSAGRKGTQNLVINVKAAKLSIKGPTQIEQGSCSTAFTFSILNSSDHLWQLAFDIDLSILESMKDIIYSDKTCSTKMETFAIESGSANMIFYIKPVTQGNVFVQIKSGGLASNEHELRVFDPLTLTASTTSVFFNKTTTLTASGGNLPYHYSIKSGGGSIHSKTGIFTAPSAKGTTEVQVTDGYNAKVSLELYIKEKAGLAFDQSDSLKFGVLSNGATTDLDVNITYSGDVNATSIAGAALTAPFSYKGGTYPGTGGTCGTEISADCKIVLTFAPATSNAYTDTLSLTFNDGISSTTSSVGLSGYSSVGVEKLWESGHSDHSCVILTDGTVKCFGNNRFGELGLGAKSYIGVDTTDMGSALGTVDIGLTTTNIVSGLRSMCATDAAGALKCWGSNEGGVLGQGDTNHRGDTANELGANLSAVNLGTGLTVNSGKVYLGWSHACAILNDNKVKCWGHNGFGQLGIGDRYTRGDEANEMGDNLSYADLGDGKTATELALGLYHTCALLNDKTVKCWGYNNVGQLGQDHTNNLGDETGEMGDSLATVSLGADVEQIAAGDNFTCARLDGNVVKCWGINTYGQLGQGNTNTIGDETGEMAALTAIPISNVSKLAVGRFHACVITTDTKVRCWGKNTFGNLGQGSTDHLGDQVDGSDVNFEITTLSAIDLEDGNHGASAISSGGEHTCVIIDDSGDTNDGKVKCWGQNDKGQLGHENNILAGTGKATETAMGGPLPFLNEGDGGTQTVDAIAAGDIHTCIIPSGTNNIQCWGSNKYGVLGISHSLIGDNKEELGANLPAVDLNQGVNSVLAVTLGYQHTCAIIDSVAGAKCWGQNQAGQLGIGSKLHKGNTATHMGANLSVTDINATATTLSSGSYFNCALINDGTVKCWGYNGDGTNLIGLLGNDKYVPVEGAGVESIGDAALEMGGNLTAAVNVSGVTKISSGQSHTCVIYTGDKVKCWGDNSSGQLGINGVADAGGADDMASLVDAKIETDDPDGPGGADPTAQTASAICSGTKHNCVIVVEDGSVRCWGDNTYGQLGIPMVDSNTDGVHDTFGAALGDSADEDINPTNAKVELGSGTVTHIACGGNHSCAVLDNTTVKCWGQGTFGRLGNGSTANIGDNENEMGDNLQAVDLGTTKTISEIKANLYHTCVRFSDKTVKCWGYNRAGNLGVGHENDLGDDASEMGENLPWLVF